MSEMRLSIDGREVAGRPGQTLLEVCEGHGIRVPTLCHHPLLTDVGACRLCVVEVEGDRRLNTACTTPAREGMVVRTDTERLRRQRLMTLELLFSERNHICPFCAQSGRCELQDLGYAFGMTHPRYPYLFPRLTPDTSSPYFVMEPNRCVLCGRCVRACDEVAGMHALDFGGRGSRQEVVADRGAPIGESSCTACGVCVEVCPTGALFEKRSAYWVRERDLPAVATTCPGCGVGCRFEAALKDGLIVRHQSASDAPVNGPLLCAKGRFGLLQEGRSRLRAPLARRDGELTEVGWPEAISAVSERLRSIRPASRVGGLISARLPSETLYQFQKFLRQAVGTGRVATFDARDLRVRRAAVRQFLGDGASAPVECGLGAVAEADAFMIVGADLAETHPVVAAWVFRAVYGRQAPLIVVGSRRTGLGDIADVWLRPRRQKEGVVLNGLLKLLADGDGVGGRGVSGEARPALAACAPAAVAGEAGVRVEDLTRAAQVYAGARAPLILYGQDLTRYGDPGPIVTLMHLAAAGGKTADGRLRLCGLAREAASAGALEMGAVSDFDAEGLDLDEVECLYLVVGDAEVPLDEPALDRLRGVQFLIAQASHRSALTDLADVVLPDLAWPERAGTFVNTEGRAQAVQRVLTPPAGARDDLEIFADLAGPFGKALAREVAEAQREMAGEVPAFLGDLTLPQTKGKSHYYPPPNLSLP